jgi:glycosyltransferase involved in cell wall biosynthesis
MKLLYLITLAERGGAQVHVADLLRGFANQFEIALCTGETGYLCDLAQSLNIPVFRIPHLIHPMRPFTDIQGAWELSRVLHAWKPDLVHAHTSKAGMLARLTGALCGVPVVFTAHTWSFSDCFSQRQRTISIPLERLAGYTGGRIITVSDSNRQLALRYRIAKPDKFVTVWNGILDTPRRASPGDGSCPRIVMVARFASPKDHTLLVLALSGIGRDFELHLIGDGPLRPQVEAKARTLGTRVTFLGERSDVDEILAQAHILALATKWEGLPLTILEGMRAGLPVVASDVGGVHEAVSHCVTGFLTPVGDPQQLQFYLHELIVDSDLRARMGAAGRARYERDFMLSEMLTRTATVYQSAMPASERVAAKRAALVSTTVARAGGLKRNG